jgi:hypothetical protein
MVATFPHLPTELTSGVRSNFIFRLVAGAASKFDLMLRVGRNPDEFY